MLYDDRVKAHLKAYPPPEGWEWKALVDASGEDCLLGEQLDESKYRIEPQPTSRHSAAHLQHSLNDALMG